MTHNSVTFTGETTGSVAPVAPVEGAAPPQERPAWLQEKFQSPEDLAKAYSELEAKLAQKGQQPPATPPATPPEGITPAPKEGDEGEGADPAQQLGAKAGFDLSVYQTEFMDTGDVAPERRAEIANGLKDVLGPDAETIVNDYIEGRKALVSNETALLYTEAGGETMYSEMVTWAGSNMSREEALAFNAAIQSGNRHTAMLAVRGLRSSYEQAQGGSAPKLLTGSGNSGRVNAGYASVAQMQADMRNPLYKSDPAFRKQVQAKLAATNTF